MEAFKSYLCRNYSHSMERKKRQGTEKPEENSRESGKYSKTPAKRGAGRSQSRASSAEGRPRRSTDSPAGKERVVRTRRDEESSAPQRGRSERPVRSERPTRPERGKPDYERKPMRGRPANPDRESRGFGREERDSSENAKQPYRQKSPGRLRREAGNYDKNRSLPERENRVSRTGSDSEGFMERKGRPSREEKPERTPFKSRRTEGEYRKPVNKPKFSTNIKKSSRSSSSSSRGAGLIRLNKFIANSGICSRREADQYILAGTIKVNGKVVTELGTKVSPTDKVQYDNHTIKSERLVYVLLNKPKGFITTTDDPFDRKTVMALVENACPERIYPVGRLDRNTTGLLLMTNDGDLAKKLTHPKHNVRKVYHVELDKALSKSDMMTIVEGIELEDGIAVVDEIEYAQDSKNKKEIGVELHSGKNRIVRRIFEALGYEVVKLDRMIFAGLTKKDVPRGHWRFLTEQEVNYLKMLK